MTLNNPTNSPKENREIKSCVFTDLFYEDITAEENMISLYNALHEEPLPPSTVIQKLRVDQVLYMNFKNDLSFGVSDKTLIIAEHQSKINRNMPIREFMYSGRLFEQIVTTDYRYRRAEISLPPAGVLHLLQRAGALGEGTDPVPVRFWNAVQFSRNMDFSSTLSASIRRKDTNRPMDRLYVNASKKEF